MSPPTPGFSRHSSVVDPDAAYASKDEVADLADKVVGLQAAIEEHDGHAQQLVSQALATMLKELPAALEAATERAMRRVMADKELHKQVGISVMEQAKTNMYLTGGKWLFSKWAAIAALAFLLAQYIGWGATFKAVFGLFKGP